MRRRVRSLRLKHLNQAGHWPSGNPRLYYRPKGEKAVPMPDLREDDPRFLRAYADAAGEAPRPPARKGSIAHAVELYLAATHEDLRASTWSRRRSALDDIRTRYGHGRMEDLAARHIEVDMDRFTAHVANNRLRAWAHFTAWAKRRRLIASDPRDGIRKRAAPRSDGHVPWSADDVTAFRKRWPVGTAERLAFEVLHWTGARISDAIRMGDGDVRDGWLAFRQRKTGGGVDVPFRADLLASNLAGMAPDLAELHRCIAARKERHLVWITTAAGAARSDKAASQWFAAKARAAGLKSRSAHGLRKTRAYALAEAQATEHQIAAWTGHESLAEVKRYTAKFDRRRALSGPQSSNSGSNVPSLARKGS